MARTRYLVRRATGDVFIWTEILAKRPDLEEVFAESAKEALQKDRLPDPRRISLDDLERMTKADLVIFGKVKLGIDLDASAKRGDLLDAVKLELFSRPSQVADDEVGPPKTETRPMSSAAQARGQRGI